MATVVGGGGGSGETQLLATISDGNGLVVNVFGTEVSGGLQIHLVVESGQADLRAFYLDMNNFIQVAAGGVVGSDVTSFVSANDAIVKVGTSDTNMNGTSVKFDLGVELGTAGSGTDYISDTTFSIAGLNFANIDGAEFGLRATSVGDGLDGGVKLVGTLDADLSGGGGNV